MKRGQSLVELLLFIALLAVFLPGLMTALVASREGRPQMQQRLQAATILKETQEQVRSVREQGWDNFIVTITPGVPYHPVSGTSWSLVAGATTVNGFTRQVVFENVIRNNSGSIELTPTPGVTVLDPSTIKVNTTIRWEKPFAGSKLESVMYLTRFRDNLTHSESTTADFTPGTKNGIDIDTTIGDGAVVLAHGSGANWCSPGNPIVKHDLGGSSLAGNVVAGNNLAYIGTGKNASSDPFYNVKIDNSVFPPVITVVGSYNTGGLKANDISGESHYGIIGTDNNSNEEIVIIDLTPNNPTYVTKIDNSGVKGANTLFVTNNILYYIGTNNKLYRYDISTINNPQARGQLQLSGGNAKKMYVVNGYVYVAMDSTSNQLQIINATNPNTLSFSGQLTLNNQPGVDVFVNTDGSRAYFITDTSSSAITDFFIINTAISKVAPQKIGSGFSTYPMIPRGITVIDNRAIIVGFSRPQYQVLNVEGDNYNLCASIPKIGDPDIDNIYDVSSILLGSHAYSYIVTDNSSMAFQIIEGGLGSGTGFLSPGTFESAPFNPGYSTAFNRFVANINQISSVTSIQMQVAVVNKVNNSCTDPGVDYTSAYIGPLGNPSQSFLSTDNSTIQGTIPFGSYPGGYVNPGQCFRYKLILSTSDSTKTPSFNDIKVNYSP